MNNHSISACVLFLFTSLFTSNSVFARELDSILNESILNMPDTLFEYRPDWIWSGEDLNSLNAHVEYTLQNEEVYVMISDDEYAEHFWLIAIKRENNYSVFDPCENSESAKSYHIEPQLKDIDGNGTKELLLYWEHVLSHSGWGGGNRNTTKGVVIWDLENITRLLDITTLVEEELWWNTIEFDSLENNEPKIIDTGREYYFESINIYISADTMTIVWNFIPDSTFQQEIIFYSLPEPTMIKNMQRTYQKVGAYWLKSEP